MPETYNGCGTWYYGKKEVFQHRGGCPHCGKIVTLSSFNTRKWVTIFYIPIIPLKQQRVIDECPACTMHRSVPLKTYEASRQKLCQEARAKAAANPKDPQAAIELLKTYSQYQDWPALQELIPAAASAFPDNPAVHSTIGHILYYLGYWEEAVDYLTHSLSIQDDQNVRETLGFVFLRLSDPDAAAEHFRFIMDGGIREKAPVLLALAEKYQHLGRHEEALAALDWVVHLDPDFEKKKPYKKLRKISEKNRHTAKPIKDTTVVKSTLLTRGSRSPHLPWVIGGIVIAFLVGLYLHEAIKRGKQPSVYLVSGLSKDYKVQIDQQSFTALSMKARSIKIPEGTYTFSVPDGGPDIPPETIELKSNFWLRPFRRTVYIINPDAVAPILETTSYYAEDPEDAPESERFFSIGSSLYTFKGIDYVFSPFPDQITDSGSGAISKKQLSLWDMEEDGDADRLSSVIRQCYDIQTLVMVLINRMLYEPENSTALFELSAYLKPETFVAIIRPGLDARPVRVDWHRLYQGYTETLEPDKDLQQEYLDRLNRFPDDPNLQYLYGRILKDPEQSELWYQKSVSGSRPCPYGYYAMGYARMANAEYTQALDCLTKACRLLPDHPHLEYSYAEALEAAKNYDQALQYYRQKQQQSSAFHWCLKEMEIDLLQHKPDAAGAVYAQWLNEQKDSLTDEEHQAVQKQKDFLFAYVGGDFSQFPESLKADPESRFIYAMNTRQPISEELEQQLDLQKAHTYLLLAIQEDRIGNAQRANDCLSKALELLRKEGPQQQLVADAIETKNMDDPKIFLNMVLEPSQKMIYLTALGWYMPQHRQAFYLLSDRLNYQVQFPHYFLKSIHQEPLQTQNP